MANTSLGTPSDTRIIIQFRSITQKIDIMIKLKLSILVWAIGLSMTAFSQTTSSLRAKVLTLNDYPDALRLWELYNDSASVMYKATQLHAKVSLYYYNSSNISSTAFLPCCMQSGKPTASNGAPVTRNLG